MSLRVFWIYPGLSPMILSEVPSGIFAVATYCWNFSWCSSRDLFHSLFQAFSQCSTWDLFIYRFSRDYSHSSSRSFYQKLSQDSIDGPFKIFFVTVAPGVLVVNHEFFFEMSPGITYESSCKKFPEKYRKEFRWNLARLIEEISRGASREILRKTGTFWKKNVLV